MADEDKSSRDLYAVLELASNATEEEIRRAFRTLAAKYHPDRSPGDAKAALRFKQINAAFQVLGDPDKKQQYDELTMPVEDMALARRPVVTPAPPSSETAATEERSEYRVRRRRASRSRRSGLSWPLLLGAPIALVVVSAFRGFSFDGNVAESAGDSAPAASAAAQEPRTAPVEVSPPSELAPLPISDSPRRVPTETSPPPLAEAARSITGDRWSFDLPVAWQDAHDAKGQRWLAPDDVGAGRASVKMVVTPFTGESASYFEDLDRRPPMGVVIDGEAWESDTKPDGLKREGRILNGRVLVSRFVEYVVASKGRGYELTCSGPADTFDGMRSTCVRILGSLRVR